MSNDKKIPVRRGSHDLVAPQRTRSVVQPDTALSAPITGFAADLRRRALEKRAREVQEQGNLIDANTRLLKSYETLGRQNARLRDLDNILEDDQADRDEERDAARHRRHMAKMARRREREEVDFQDARHAAHAQADLDKARRLATEAARDAKAAANISDQEVEKLYLEKATARMAEEIKYHVADEALKRRTAPRTEPAPPPGGSLEEAIRKTERDLENARRRNDLEDVKNKELFLDHLKALLRSLNGDTG